MSLSYAYLERLTPDAEPVEVTLPETRADALDWYRQIGDLAETDPNQWQLSVRLGMASDLYFCGLFHTFCWAEDPFTGRAEVDSDFQFEYARWLQEEGDDCVDYTARGHWKTTWRQVRATQEIIRDPNVSIIILSFDLASGSQKHLIRWKTEIERNELIKTAWSDVFYWNPREEGASWSVENGCTVKRTLNVPMPTISAGTFMAGLKTGARLTIIWLDDVETEKTVEKDEQREKAKARFKSALALGGRRCRKWIVGTFHHPEGMLADCIKSGWRAQCFEAEDISKPAPDIAAIYDECGGVRPDTKAKMPKEIREIRLRGAPRYLSPLECAINRFEMGHDVYETQFMGDPLAGLVMRFKAEWIAEENRYDGNLRRWAHGKTAVLVTDPSKGIENASAALLIACDRDRTMMPVAGFMRKLSPTDYYQELYMMCREWEETVRITQLRVEVVGQSTWDTNIRMYFNSRHYVGPPIYACSQYTQDKYIKIWTRCEPMFRKGDIRLPTRIMTPNDSGVPYNLIKYFIDREYTPFPMPGTDELLDCFSMLDEPADKVPPIEYPVSAWAPEEEEEEQWEEAPVPGLDRESFLWS